MTMKCAYCEQDLTGLDHIAHVGKCRLRADADARARRDCRHEFQDTKYCHHCGVDVQTLSDQRRDELLRFALADTESSNAAATDRFVEVLRTCTSIIDAVAGGATLILVGPDPLQKLRRFGATLESATGAKCAQGYGPTLTGTLAELARVWQRELPHPTPPSHPEPTTIVDGEPQAVDWKFQGKPAVVGPDLAAAVQGSTPPLRNGHDDDVIAEAQGNTRKST